MKRSHVEAKGADWYAKGVKSVEVGLRLGCQLTYRTSGNCFLHS